MQCGEQFKMTALDLKRPQPLFYPSSQLLNLLEKELLEERYKNLRFTTSVQKT